MSEVEKVVWKFVLADSSTMANIGELQATNKQFEFILNRPGSASFRMPLTRPLADEISVITTCLKIYRTTPSATNLVWSGPIWNIDDIVHEESMNVTAVGWFEILNHRFLRYEKRYTANDKTAGQIALDLLTIANNQKDGPLSAANPDGNGTTRPTGITVGTTSDTGTKNRIYPQWQSIGQAIQEWSEIENGYDFEITPDTKTLNIYASAFPGTLRRDRPQAQFGFNWGPHNLLEFSRTTESAELVNSQFAVGKFGSHALSQNTTSMDTYGLWENSQTLSEITDTNVLAAFANGEVAIRSTPKIVYRILPHPYDVGHSHVPEPFVDYRIGDHVYITAKYPPRVSVSQQAMRVYGMSIQLQDSGSEKLTTLQVSP
jgi:hypothetical protein